MYISYFILAVHINNNVEQQENMIDASVIFWLRVGATTTLSVSNFMRYMNDCDCDRQFWTSATKILDSKGGLQNFPLFYVPKLKNKLKKDLLCHVLQFM